VELRQVRLVDPEAGPLLRGLTAEYLRRYGDDGEMSSVGARDFEPPDGVFVVLLDDGVTVAGGGLRRLSPDCGEVKRMWTAPERRRRGHASVVLDALEEAATERGYSRLRLETGPAQPETRALYEARRYREIPVYGNYEQATAYELLLGTGQGPRGRASARLRLPTPGRSPNEGAAMTDEIDDRYVVRLVCGHETLEVVPRGASSTPVGEPLRCRECDRRQPIVESFRVEP